MEHRLAANRAANVVGYARPTRCKAQPATITLCRFMHDRFLKIDGDLSSTRMTHGCWKRQKKLEVRDHG
jgi:hypothetical protein